MSVIQVEAAGQEVLDRATRMLAGIDGGIDKAVKSAMARAVSHLRTNSTKAIQERYAISAANLLAEENVKVRYTYQGGVQAFVTFAFIAAMGIPSAVMGFVMWKLERRISKREAEAEEREKAQEKLFILIVQSSGAAIALGEATARAVQRIPDAHCNGDMHAALEYATDIKHKQKDFLMEQGIQALWD